MNHELQSEAVDLIVSAIDKQRGNYEVCTASIHQQQQTHTQHNTQSQWLSSSAAERNHSTHLTSSWVSLSLCTCYCFCFFLFLVLCVIVLFRLLLVWLKNKWIVNLVPLGIV
jgi:hypothetical protein